VAREKEKEKSKDHGIVQPMIEELKGTLKPRENEVMLPDPPPGGPEQPAELDQDAGGGYNPDGTFPQT
jgi:hypothetical protein